MHTGLCIAVKSRSRMMQMRVRVCARASTRPASTSARATTRFAPAGFHALKACRELHERPFAPPPVIQLCYFGGAPDRARNLGAVRAWGRARSKEASERIAGGQAPSERRPGERHGSGDGTSQDRQDKARKMVRTPKVFIKLLRDSGRDQGHGGRERAAPAVAAGLGMGGAVALGGGCRESSDRRRHGRP